MRSAVRAGYRWAVGFAVGLAWLGFAPVVEPANAAAPVASLSWFVTMVSQPMEYVGHGGVYRFDESTASMYVEVDTADHFRFHWDTPEPNDYFVDISVPGGLKTGHFRSHPNVTGTGEIRVAGAGYGCNLVASRFEIRDLHRDPSGHVDRLDVLYEQHCEALEPALFGQVRLGIPTDRTLRTQPTAVRWPDTLLSAPGTTAAVEVRNLTRTAVDITSVQLAGTGAVSYQLDRNGCEGRTVTRTTRCVIFVRFHPMRAGPASAYLVIRTTAGTRRVPLDGTGLGGVTKLHMESDSDDWIGSGYSDQPALYTYTPRNSLYYLRGAAWEEPPTDGIRVWLFAANGPSWDLQFVAPPTEHLTPGTYVDDIADWRSRPGLSITGANRGCQDLQGTFTVHQITYDRFDHTPTRFDISFEQHCDGSSDALRGRLRYRATTG